PLKGSFMLGRTFLLPLEQSAPVGFEARAVVVGFVFMPDPKVRPAPGQWTRFSRVFWHKNQEKPEGRKATLAMMCDKDYLRA
ncbi:MAG: hypothetical protein AAGB22_14250, partial [Bacteroidota bacterium]